jgi:hypothetical protein
VGTAVVMGGDRTLCWMVVSAVAIVAADDASG